MKILILRYIKVMVKEMKGYNFLIARKLDNFLNLLSLIKLQKKSFNKVLLN